MSAVAVRGEEVARVGKRKMLRLGKAGDPCTLQDLYLQECLLAVKLAAACRTAEELRAKLEAELPQNSPETREMYSQRITRWLFPNGALDSAPLAAWRAYRDEQILLDHFRGRYLEAVPLLGKFVVGPVASVGVGAVLDQESVQAFVARECSRAIPKTVERLPRILSRLGFLVRAGKGFARTVPTYDPTSVILELHRAFAPAPTTMPFAEIAQHPFWRYVGVPDLAALESILYDAVAQRLLAKFVKSDELNQVTTGHSYSELLPLHLRMGR